MKNPSQYTYLSDYTINRKQLLGKGATGEVYAAKNLIDQMTVAIKIIDLKTIDNEVTQYLLDMEKVAIMKVIHPNVLRGLRVSQNPRYCYIVTELCNGGSLKSMIRGNGPLGQEKSTKILIEILKGMCSIIGQGIIHRDLKPANILFHNGQAKIIDFGYCQIKGFPKPSLEYNVGSPSYMSPEAFLQNEYSEKSQIWALGVTFYQCLNGKTFDDGKNMSDVFKQIRKTGLPYKTYVSQKNKRIIDWCLQFDPKKRPSCLQLLNFILDDQKKRPSSQSVRLSFSPIENIELKARLLERKNKSKQNMEDLLENNMSKEGILKSGGNKPKPGLSTYTQRKKFFQKKYLDKRSTYNPIKTKYERSGDETNENKPHTVQRHKSQLFDIEPLLGFATDRFKTKKDNPLAFNPARSKILSKLSGDHNKYRHLFNHDYYGLSSN